ncbi:MAG: extracellular solute-binding protein [Actinobacteria bacterium]|nr:extracellular solute-binding protein [Actinomycetota bacterium]
MKKSLIFVAIMLVCFLAISVSSLSGCKEEPAATEDEAKETSEKVKIEFWLGGQWDIPELFDYMTDAAVKFMAENPNIEVEVVNLASETYFEQFLAVGETQKGPDIVFTWPGVWTVEYAWKGWLAPLEDYIPESEMSHYINTESGDSWEGKHYRFPYWLSGRPILYNKTLFEQAGLDPDNFPETWDELMSTCQTLKDAGITPWGFGAGTYGGEHLFGFLGHQMMDSPLDMIEMSLGEKKDMTDPQFAVFWDRVYEMYEKGYFPEDASSLTLWQGLELFEKGEAAMAFISEVAIGRVSGTFGPENVGAAVTPVWGTGSLAGRYVLEVQGACITSWSEHKQEAADFLMYLHNEDAMKQQYLETKAIIPDDRFDKSIITDPAQLKNYDLLEENGIADYMTNFIPPLVLTEGVNAGMELLIAGELDGKGVVDLCEEIAEKWRTSDPEAVENWKIWAEEGGF